jgi:hypothetical protein
MNVEDCYGCSGGSNTVAPHSIKCLTCGRPPMSSLMTCSSAHGGTGETTTPLSETCDMSSPPLLSTTGRNMSSPTRDASPSHHVAPPDLRHPDDPLELGDDDRLFSGLKLYKPIRIKSSSVASIVRNKSCNKFCFYKN